MRVAMVIVGLCAVSGCAFNRSYLRPVAEVRDTAAESLACADVTVRALGSTAYESTAEVHAYSADGCGRTAFFLCDAPESDGVCAEVPEPPYQTPPPSEAVAIVEIDGAWIAGLPEGADRVWERVSFGDGYRARYVDGTPGRVVALRPGARRMTIAAGPSGMVTRGGRSTHIAFDYRSASASPTSDGVLVNTSASSPGVVMDTVVRTRTRTWQEREQQSGCEIALTFAPVARATYRIEYRASFEQCIARCTKITASGAEQCEGFEAQPAG